MVHSCQPHAVLSAAILMATCVPCALATEPERPPNIVIFLADDMGCAEMGCQGNRDIPTPHIDLLASNGVRFTNGYVTCPVCAPTRAGLMTGRYQQRFGFEVLDTPRKHELEEQTLIFFLSDNGGPTAQTTSGNTPLRGFKGPVWEGDIRIPFSVQWKGHLPAGKVDDRPVVALDMHPTAVAAAGEKIPTDWNLDGVNLLPYLTGEQTGRPHETLCWRMGAKHAIRQGDWKLVWERELPRPALFDLTSDISEQTDLADKLPEKVKELSERYRAWDAQMEKPRWEWGGGAREGQRRKRGAAGKAGAKSAPAEIEARFKRFDPMKHTAALTIVMSLTLWVTASALAQQVAAEPDAVAWELARQYHESGGGQALVVLRDGKLIHESYAHGGSKDRRQMLASGSKSFVGVAALAAIEDGFIHLDDAASEAIEEWKDDPRKARITYRQLLTLTSGVLAGERGAAVRSPSWKEIVAKPMSGEPGQRFVYGAYHLIAFCEALQRELGGESFEAYLKRRVLDPIGVNVEWKIRCTDGQPQVGGGAYMTAREWATFGEFVRCEGAWNGKQVIRADLWPLLTQATPQNPAYGLTWWLSKPVSADLVRSVPILQRDMGDIANSGWLPDDLSMAAGAGKQRLYVIPSLELIVVRQGPLSAAKSFSDVEFLSCLLRGRAAKNAGERKKRELSNRDPRIKPQSSRGKPAHQTE